MIGRNSSATVKTATAVARMKNALRELIIDGIKTGHRSADPHHE